MNNFEKQGTSKPEASNEKVNGDMAWEEELEQDDVQLATDELAGVVGGCGCAQDPALGAAQDPALGAGGYNSWTETQREQYNNARFNETMRGLRGY